MTVLHVLDHSVPLLSGYASRSRSIVTWQRRLGLRPVVVTSPKHGPSPAPMEEVDGVPHYRTPPADGGRRNRAYAGEIRLMVGLARRIAEIARREGARVLHAHSPILTGLPTLWVGRRLGLPVVYEARAFWEDAAVDHGTTREGALRYRVTRALETLVFRNADAAVTIAEAMRREVIARGVPAERVTVVPNGVDTETFRPAPRDRALAARLGLDGEPVLGFIGSFYRYEGLRFLVEALPDLRARVPGCRLLLVGGGEEDEALRAAARSLGDAVIFAGRVPHDAVRDYYSLIDVFVCPRRRMRLTELVTPLKPLEAMAMAIPVLASDVGGLRELITHDVTGLTFPPDSAPGLVAGAERLGRDPALRQRLGASGRAHVERERTWPRIATRYVELYRGLCAR